MPNHHLQRAKARIWIDFFNSRIHAAAHDITHDKEPEKAQQRMRQYLKVLDEELAGKRFLLGDFSLVEATFIPFYVRRQRYKVTIDDSLPNLKRWGEDLIARPAVASTL
jgi:glutathione S-transferase